ncbi:MAG: sugar ABC transporter permease [Clostridia bacterium]|nr:sugar ABC transporter permease [Clostridia bacterium]
MHKRLTITAAAVALALTLICFIVVDLYTSRTVLGAYKSAAIGMADVAKGYYLNWKRELEAETARFAAILEGADAEQLRNRAGLIEAPSDMRRLALVSEHGETIWLQGVATASGNDLCDSLMLEAALSGRCVSDPELAEGEVLMVSASPFSTADGQTWAVVVSSAFGNRYVDTLASIAHKDVLFMLDDKVAACSRKDLTEGDFALPASFLDSITHKLDADVTEIRHNGEACLVSAVPVLDFDEWSIKGYIGVSTAKASAGAHLDRARLWFWLGASVALALLAAGMWSAVCRIDKRLSDRGRAAAGASGEPALAQGNMRRKVLALLACSLLPSVFVTLWLSNVQVPKVVREINCETSAAVGAIVRTEASEDYELIARAADEGIVDGRSGAEEVDLDEILACLCKLSSSEVTVLRSDSAVIASTLSEGDRANIKMPSKLAHDLASEDVAAFRASVKGVPKETAAVALRRDSRLVGWLTMTRDCSACDNRVVGYKFGVLGILAGVVLACGVCFFTVANADRPSVLKRSFVGYGFVAPSLIHLVWWGLLPLVFALYLAFHSWSIVTPARPFVGLDNFREVFHDRIYWNAMKNTVIFLLHIPFGMALSLAIALALKRQVRGITVWRAVYYLPAVTSSVVTSIMWKWMYNPEFGLFNYLLGWIGLGPYPWLTRPGWAMLSLLIMTIWQNMGQDMLIFLSGLQSIPSEYYEAASLDGADGFRKFWHITLPLLRPTTFFILVTSVIGSFQVFTPVYVLTGGGPLRSTDVVVYRIYQTAWVDMRMGYASAQSWVLFAIILVFTMIQFKLMGKEVRYV